MRHACNRVPAHRLLFEKLLGSMPMDAADSIQEVGNDIYCVPSSDKSQVYEVWRDIGVCSCRCGRQGAYCKHQALVYSKFGGMFPNAPALTQKDRHELACLASAEKCPPVEFFADFREQEKDEPNNEDPACSPSNLEPPLDVIPEVMETTNAEFATTSTQGNSYQV